MTTAWFGYHEGWFVVEVDPFTQSQGDDVSVPEDLLKVLQQATEGMFSWQISGPWMLMRY